MSDNTLLASIDKLKGFDLNLLLSFEAIFIHKSVSKAALLLGITPSAVSQSLSRLRSFFDDPLFVREGKGLVATTAAENLHIQLSGGFNQLLNSLDYFTDTATKSKFIIHSTAYAAMRILPPICSEIEAANLRYEIFHIGSDATLTNDEDILIYRKADIIFDTKPYYSFSTVTELFFVEEVVPICRKDHPRLDKTLTPEEMKLESSTRLMVGSDGVKRVQSDLQTFFGEREYSFSSSSIIALTAMTEATNCVSFIPKWFAAKAAESFNVKVLESTCTPDPVAFYMTYNKTSLKNSSFLEILQVIHKCKELYSAP